MYTLLSTHFDAIAFIFALAVLVFLQYRKGAPEVSDEVAKNYKELAQQLKDQKADLEKKLTDQSLIYEKKLTEQASAHNKEMNELHRQMGEKDSTILMQREIIENQNKTIENRNPDLEGILGEIKDFLKEAVPLIRETHESSMANSHELSEQTKLLKSKKVVVLKGAVEGAETSA